MNLYLVDADPDVASALAAAFAPFREVSVARGDLLALARNAVVSPANGYGFMDGGIDAAYARFFGPRVEAAVRDATDARPEGYLPVGASLVVDTGHARVPYLILAPTMLMPEAIPSLDCYRAMRAVLRVAGRDAGVGRAVYCPGLGTGVGAVDPGEAAAEMARAYGEWKAISSPEEADDSR